VKPVRVLLLLLALLLAGLQYTLWLGNGGHQEVAALRQQVATQQVENLRLQERNGALAAEVEDLKSGEAAVEERARSELGMVKPGETFYRVVEDAPASTVAPAAAPATSP
jgi:cell division protein FtsB